MSTFVLVHGSFSAGYCWREVTPQLVRNGHHVVPIDLPAHGDDQTPPNDVSLQTYVDALKRIVAAQNAPPVLVVHSMSGHVVHALESDPDAVAGVVFVAGLIPPDGETMMQSVERFDPAYLAQAVWAEDRRSAWLSPAGVREFACQLAPEDVVNEVVQRMRPEPLGPYGEPVATTPGRFGRTRRYYVETLRDRILPLSMQRATQERVGFRHVFSLDADHCPFFSAPEQLASCLNAVATGL